jgi:predicted AAA+ superfamily ATPase
MPALLNEVQVMMDRHPGLHFVLTGSSARSLRRRGVNLLGGRAGTLHLFPLVSSEVEFADWEKRLCVGSLPGVLTSVDPWERLRSYVSTYLTEEIRAEGFVRSLEAFSHFLATAAATNTRLVNYTQVGSDAGVPPRTVREYFQLLEDTLLGFLLPPYQGTTKRKAVAASKFYLFDVGVANYFGKRFHLERDSAEYGTVLEHALVLECRAYLSYRRRFEELCYWRSQSGQEVDIVIGEKLAVEIKASRRVGRRDLKGLLALREERPGMRFIVVAEEPQFRKTEEGIEVFPVAEFLRRLWADELLATL